jgi:hypothetical protein
MDRERVGSSSIESVGYDPATGTLEIQFHNTGRYHYFEVPPPVYADLMLARSKGEYFNTQIRDLYSCRKIA